MIRFEHVKFSWGARPVLTDVNFHLRAGSFCAVLGRNGAGKSTCVRLMSSEITPGGGAIFWEDRALSELSPEILSRRRGVLPQQSFLSFPFTVEQVVLLGRFPYAKDGDPARDREIAQTCMKKAGLGESFKDRSYLELSAGERQRVHLARALAQVYDNREPCLLLLDEPVSSLDISHQHAVLALARAVAAKGNAVFAVLHDLNLAAQYADEILLLHEGRVLA